MAVMVFFDEVDIIRDDSYAKYSSCTISTNPKYSAKYQIVKERQYISIPNTGDTKSI